MPRDALVQRLLASPEPAVRWRTRVRGLGEPADSPDVRRLQEDIRNCPRVMTLLSGREADGRLLRGRRVYQKWQGAHWVLAALADLGYPPGDAALDPIGNQVAEAWLDPAFYMEFEADTKAHAYRKRGVPVMNGRYRRCASQQGNTLYFLTRLGIAAERRDALVERLLYWQWPDGGWNCDKAPKADSSSFMETLLPMLGLWHYGSECDDEAMRESARRAADVFLTRRLFKSRSTGDVIHPTFMELQYPPYWHYNFLAGLKAMADMGLIRDPRCNDALDLLERKELPDGGWPAESKNYHVTSRSELHADCVDWGPGGKMRMNEWVTTDALYVLRMAGR